MSEREFIILAKKGCPFCIKVEDFFQKNPQYMAVFCYSNIDFQDQEFKDKFGEKSTYPRVYERLENGKKVFFGDSGETIKKLSLDKKNSDDEEKRKDKKKKNSDDEEKRKDKKKEITKDRERERGREMR